VGYRHSVAQSADKGVSAERWPRPDEAAWNCVKIATAAVTTTPKQKLGMWSRGPRGFFIRRDVGF
jgi:hypothetical protein